MRRRSHRTSQRSKSSDFLDDLENDSRHTAQQPTPLVRPKADVRSFHTDDRRRWAPGSPGFAPRAHPRDAHGRNARISHEPKRVAKVHRGPGGKPLQSRPNVKHRVIRSLENASPRFAEARKTFICLKRKVRREVLFAFKRTRSGAGKRKRRNQWSDVQC